MSNITIYGYLIKDASFNKGNDPQKDKATLAVAVQRKYNKDINDIFNVICWGPKARYVKTGLDQGLYKKGTFTIVEGRMESSSFDDKETGKKRVSWQLVAEEIRGGFRTPQVTREAASPGYAPETPNPGYAPETPNPGYAREAASPGYAREAASPGYAPRGGYYSRNGQPNQGYQQRGGFQKGTL